MSKKRQFKLYSENKDEEKLSDISDISCPEQPEFQPIKSNKPKKKRHKFTHSQDKKMLEYIMDENRYDEIKGLALWKDMEILKITNHSKQSMRCRFLKMVIPNLHQYDVPKTWFDKLKWLFPDLLQKHPDKENAKADFPVSTMLEKWKRQSPRLQSSPRQAANGVNTTAKGSNMSEDEKCGRKRAEKKDDDGCESTEPYTESPISHRRAKKRLLKQTLQFDSSSESDAEEKKVPVNESPITPRRGKKRQSKRLLPINSSSESDTAEEEVPVNESPITPRRGKKRQSKRLLPINSSSESDTAEEEEKNVSTASGVASAKSADPTPSKSAEDASKDVSSGEQSDLSDYDQYLMGIATKSISSSKKSPRSVDNVSQSDKTNTTYEECVPDSAEEMDQNDSIHVVEDRRSRLRHRRHLKKIQKAFGNNSTPTTPSPKKGKKPNLAEFVTYSHPEEILLENGDEESCSPEKDCDELSEYETIISDIAKSYGLTNREVLSTIFSFNGNIEKNPHIHQTWSRIVSTATLE